MATPRATDPPTREGVTLHRNGLFEIPAKRKSWSEAGYRARYDTDVVYVWTYANTPHACPVRFGAAGPVSANVMIRSFLAKGQPVVVFWGDDPGPSAAENLYADRANAIPVELRGIWESRLPQGAAGVMGRIAVLSLAAGLLALYASTLPAGPFVVAVKVVVVVLSLRSTVLAWRRRRARTP